MDKKVIIGDFEITTISVLSTGTNCYVVCHIPSNELFVVDPGGESERIIRTIDDYLGELRYIFFTHAHHEHIGAAADLYDEYNVPGVIHKADSRMLREAHTIAMETSGRPIRQVIGYRAFVKEPEFHFGGQLIKAVHTPGHTPGSVCYALEKFIFTGDTLLYRALGEMEEKTTQKSQKAQDPLQPLFSRYSSAIMLFPGRGPAWRLSEARRWWQQARLHSTRPSLMA